jgi:glycosyltransferase involved in cell wall biosynthesis
MNLVTIFTSSFNDEIMLPFNLKWYKERFPDSRIVVLDNKSTDKSVQVALDYGCESVVFDSKDQLPIEIGQWIKNNTWKRATTDWVIFIDCDEFLDISENDLEKEHEFGATFIKTCGWDVVNLKDDLDIENMNWGRKNYFFNKLVCFKKSQITEINYDIGAHTSRPVGILNPSKETYNLLHKHFVNVDYVHEKYKRNYDRLSEEHRQKGWGVHYKKDRETIAKEFAKLRGLGQKI